MPGVRHPDRRSLASILIEVVQQFADDSIDLSL